jgi:hypothetical protein
VSSMSVSASASSPWQPIGGASTATRPQSPIAALASTLGLSVQDITSQLQQGKSLNDIATAQGVSHEDQLQNSANATSIAEQIAGATGLAATQGAAGTSGTQGHHHHHHHSSGSGAAAQVSNLNGASTGVISGSLTDAQQQTLSSLSSLLGTDSSSLLTSLQSGSSLADLVSNAGVSSSSLASVLQDGLLVDTTS